MSVKILWNTLLLSAWTLSESVKTRKLPSVNAFTMGNFSGFNTGFNRFLLYFT